MSSRCRRRWATPAGSPGARVGVRLRADPGHLAPSDRRSARPRQRVRAGRGPSRAGRGHRERPSAGRAVRSGTRSRRRRFGRGDRPRATYPAPGPGATARGPAAAGRDGIPVFLLGDFNAPSHLDWTAAAVGSRPHLRAVVDWPVSRAIEAAGFRDTWREIHPDPVAEPGLTWWADRPPTGRL